MNIKKLKYINLILLSKYVMDRGAWLTTVHKITRVGDNLALNSYSLQDRRLQRTEINLSQLRTSYSLFDLLSLKNHALML